VIEGGSLKTKGGEEWNGSRVEWEQDQWGRGRGVGK